MEPYKLHQEITHLIEHLVKNITLLGDMSHKIDEIKTMVNETPNDQELGEKIRLYIKSLK